MLPTTTDLARYKPACNGLHVQQARYLWYRCTPIARRDNDFITEVPTDSAGTDSALQTSLKRAARAPGTLLVVSLCSLCQKGERLHYRSSRQAPSRCFPLLVTMSTVFWEQYPLISFFFLFVCWYSSFCRLIGGGEILLTKKIIFQYGPFRSFKCFTNVLINVDLHINWYSFLYLSC